MSYLAAQITGHWRGRSSICFAILGVGILIILLGRLLAYSLFVVGSLAARIIDPAYVALTNLIIYQIFFLSIFVWWVVGLWRISFGLKSSAWIWSALLGVLVVFLVSSQIAYLLLTVLPEIEDVWADIEGDAQWGASEVKLSGRIVKVEGPITRVTAERFAEAIANDSQISEVRFDSPGGRIAPAEQIRRMITSRHINTSAESDCSSACVIAFMGGVHRTVRPWTRIGFHSFSIGNTSADIIDASVQAELAQLGVRASFLRQAYSSSVRPIWYPSAGELKTAHVVTDIRK